MLEWVLVLISDQQMSLFTDGTHIKVNHKNHGMYDDSNTVTISGVAPDTKPTKLTAAYAADSTGALTVESGSQFFTFENVGVGTTNAGYIQIGDEIIGYTTATGKFHQGNYHQRN